MSQWLYALTFITAVGLSSTAHAAQPGDLAGYLRTYLGTAESVRHSAAEFDLNGDGRNEVIAYITEAGRCGSGGCLALVLEQSKSTYRVRMRSTVTRPPIRVLETRRNGWRDIAVSVGGGGVTSREVTMRFDGVRYPSNPTMQPPIPTAGQVGETVIAP